MKTVPEVDDEVVVSDSSEADIYRVVQVRGHQVKLQIEGYEGCLCVDCSAVMYPTCKQLNRVAK